MNHSLNFSKTDDLCKLCDGKVDCAPTAILIISLIHALYGSVGQEPDYFGGKSKMDFYRKPEDIESNQVENQYDLRSGLGEEWSPRKVIYPKNYKNDRSSGSFMVDDSMTSRVEDTDLRTVETYDFIVVGGGTAGCVLASRLSETRKWKVLLIEAGIDQPNLALIPGLTEGFWGSPIDWKYTMRPNSRYCQNRGRKGCEVLQGRVMGGTSAINDMAYTRGNQMDYDEWAMAGNEGWSYSQTLPYFKYAEGNYDEDIGSNTFYHSTQGPLDVGRYSYFDKNMNSILNALTQLGLNETDVNGKQQHGYMKVQSTTYMGERVSSYAGFIDPIKNLRPNLRILKETLVTKILFKKVRGKTIATGVEFLRQGALSYMLASKEVIISAGAINSPKLLMQSGIGPSDYLKFINIKPILNLPVGKNFQDHISVCLPIIRPTKNIQRKNFDQKLKDVINYYENGTGPLSSNFPIIAYIETDNSRVVGTPDIELSFRGHNSHMYYKLIDACVSLISPNSRGAIFLNSTDPLFSPPLIYPNYLGEKIDEISLLKGIYKVLQLFQTEAFQRAGLRFDASLLMNNECRRLKRNSIEFWTCVIKYFSAPMHDYAGTCKMSPTDDKDSVVDSMLKVHGVSNLRVVDASIMPIITRGRTSAPVIMIAEKASDLIKSFWF